MRKQFILKYSDSLKYTINFRIYGSYKDLKDSLPSKDKNFFKDFYQCSYKIKNNEVPIHIMSGFMTVEKRNQIKVFNSFKKRINLKHGFMAIWEIEKKNYQKGIHEEYFYIPINFDSENFYIFLQLTCSDNNISKTHINDILNSVQINKSRI